jgi:hypothetical protein
MAGIDWTKRAFLQAMGGSIPALKLALGTSDSPAPTHAGPASSGKFVPLDCTPYYNASASDIEALKQIRIPAGSQQFRGVPFSLGSSSETSHKSWIALSRTRKSSTTSLTEIPIGIAASFVCFAQFCDWDSNERPEPNGDAFEKAGQELAHFTIVFQDSSEHVHFIRRRFEVNSLTVPWGHLCFSAVPHRPDVACRLTDPYKMLSRTTLL